MSDDFEDVGKKSMRKDQAKREMMRKGILLLVRNWYLIDMKTLIPK